MSKEIGQAIYERDQAAIAWRSAKESGNGPATAATLAQWNLANDRCAKLIAKEG